MRGRQLAVDFKTDSMMIVKMVMGLSLKVSPRPMPFICPSIDGIAM